MGSAVFLMRCEQGMPAGGLELNFEAIALRETPGSIRDKA